MRQTVLRICRQHPLLTGSVAALLTVLVLHHLIVLITGTHPLIIGSHHHCHHHHHHAHRMLANRACDIPFLGWMTAPGVPDATFGCLCVYSNAAFVTVGGVLWSQQRNVEFFLIALVTVASTVYHSLQVHPPFGPFHELTSSACNFDITLAVTLFLYIGFRYPKTRARALPSLAGAMVCYLAPSLMPEGAWAEVGYSILHSAWHLFAATAVYAVASKTSFWAQGRTVKSWQVSGSLLSSTTGYATAVYSVVSETSVRVMKGCQAALQVVAAWVPSSLWSYCVYYSTRSAAPVTKEDQALVQLLTRR